MVGELAGDRRGSTRFNGGQPQGVVTPRAEIDPQRYEIAKLGETKQFADDIRSQVAEKSRELAEMNERLIAFGDSLLAAPRASPMLSFGRPKRLSTGSPAAKANDS